MGDKLLYTGLYQDMIWMASFKHKIIYRSIKTDWKIIASKLSILLSDTETYNISCLLKN